MKKIKHSLMGGGWNYRIVCMPDNKLKGLPQTYSYGIYEVYYDKKGVPRAWSQYPMHPIGETFKDLADDCYLMSGAFCKKILVCNKSKTKLTEK